ncbi:A-kinase anchor protein SPHKAP-like isoform X2 [Coregonus clupeaformis]|uniref:A-kinase anchor protein SPHKAP-like isoform X2 n=1 Tax=Coregonus clupeaformis TaxID=59861 RepID=UPI001E1C8F3A|nr:A-kinase anchor protein SPHKAP-like isoform X2 [Coregonus clupeaformis]
MAGAKCLLKTPSNFQSSAMFESSESADAEGVSTDSTLGSSVTACKKVLCSSSVLDSSEYWLRNEKALCRLGLLEDDAEGRCNTICFVNLDQQKVDRHEDSCIKKLASISPELPKLVDSLSVRQPKVNEILLLGGLETPDPSHPHQYPTHTQGQRDTDLCLVQCAGGRRPTSIIYEINKFLIGLQWGQERQGSQGRMMAGQRLDDDTNRSFSSIEEDFLTASEHLGDDSEDDGLRNEPECLDVAEGLADAAHSDRPVCQRGRLGQHQWQDSEDSESTICAPLATMKRGGMVPVRASSHHTKESAGHYATNLAESVLQDAFIRLSQDEPSFTPEAAVSMFPSSHRPPASLARTGAEEPSRARACSFELPKIVIVQSPDSCEGLPEWLGTQASHVAVEHGVGGDAARQVLTEHGPETHDFRPTTTTNGRYPTKPLQRALACAASVIGTISSPQVAEQLAMEPTEEDMEREGQRDPEGTDYSFSSAMCGMAQVAGSVAVVELAEEAGEGGCESEDDSTTEVYSAASVGLLSAAQASTAITLHCSVAEGTSIEAFRTSIAEVLHKEAAGVLAQPQDYKSVAHLLESTHNRIVDGITSPKKSCLDKMGETEVDNFISEVADGLFKHAFKKAKKKKELEGPGKDVPDIQGFLQESVSNVLFDILCLTSKRIGDISKCDIGSFDRQEGDVGFRDYEAAATTKEPLSQLLRFVGSSQTDNCEAQWAEKTPVYSRMREEKYGLEERESEHYGSHSSPHIREQQQRRQAPTKVLSSTKDCYDLQGQQARGNIREPFTESLAHQVSSSLGTEKRWRASTDSRQSSLTPQSSFSSSSTGALVCLKMDSESRTTPVNYFADDLATTVVSMATELAAICLENSSGKQPWFCALKGAAGYYPEGGYLLPSCCTALRRKEGQNGGVASKKHRPPRLSEIKRKTEEQPELMECLVNRVVDETVNLDDMPQTLDPFALFASEVTARIMNCPELNVVDTSKPGQQTRSRLQCERWSRGKAASYESIPEEDAGPPGTPNTLGPGSRLGQNLSRGGSISKQSSCESITDEFSRFMVNQMETEGRGFDLLLDYYAGQNASSILAAAVQQAATKKNGHLNVRTTSCLSKQSSTESITEEFYRFMLKDMDKESKDYSMGRTKEWSNSLLPPSPRTLFCIRQSSVPDRRFSDSRLTVNSPIKANSFDGFVHNGHGDTLNIYPTNSVQVSATGLCKSDSCLYQRGQTDQITDMLIHETWSSSIESLMRKNKIIADPEDSIDLVDAESQTQVLQYANRLAADIVETGKSVLQEGDGAGGGGVVGRQQHMPVGERRRGFKQSRPGCTRSRASQEQSGGGGDSTCTTAGPPIRGPREVPVPVIHIETDQRDDPESGDPVERAGRRPWDPTPPEGTAQWRAERALVRRSSCERDRTAVSSAPAAVTAVGERNKRSLSASSEDSSGSWSQIAPDDEPHEETSSFIQLSEGNGNSSTSSLGLADLEGFSDIPTQSTVNSEEAEKDYLRENVDEGISLRSVGGSSNHRELLVVNCDLDPECVDSELRLALQWIAASELGLHAVYFRKCKDRRTSKFQRVVQLVSQKAWRIRDLFSAVIQFCKLHQEEEDGGSSLTSLFDWLLETH